MANGLFHAKPSAQRYGEVKSKPSLFDDDDPTVSGAKARQLGVVSKSRRRKADEPGPEHHAAAAKLVKRNNRVGARFTDPDSIQDPKLREAYESQLLDEHNEHQANVEAGKVTQEGQKIIGPGDLGRGAKRTVTGAMGAGAKAGGVGGGAVNNGAGFLLGILAYGLVAAYLQGGTPLARQWLAAKFLNHAGPTSTGKTAQGQPAGPDNAGQVATNNTVLQAWIAAGGDPSTGAFGTPDQNAARYPDGITSTYLSQVPGGH